MVATRLGAADRPLGARRGGCGPTRSGRSLPQLRLHGAAATGNLAAGVPHASDTSVAVESPGSRRASYLGPPT